MTGPPQDGLPAAPRSRWPYLSLIPLGFGAWAPIYAGVKVRRPVWILLGVLWCLIAVAGWVHNGVSGQGGHDDLAGFLLLLGWVGGIVTSFTVRSAYDRELASPLSAVAEAGRARLEARARARQIVRDNPALAREMGIGRPERTAGSDGGLVDLNNASATALLTVDGVDDALATRIIETRRQVRGFSSLEDMGTVLDLDPDRVEAMREQAVFLPRVD